MELANYIKELLFENDCIIIPNFGGFIVQYRPSEIFTTEHLITPPAKTIVFNKQLVENDGLLINHIAKKQNNNFAEAEKWLTQRTLEINHALQTYGSYSLPAIGTFDIDIERNMKFSPLSSANFLKDSFGLPTIKAIPIAHQNTEEKIAVIAEKLEKKAKEEIEEPLHFNWNVAAVVLLFLSMMGVLQLMQSSFHPKSLQLNTASVFSFFENNYIENKNIVAKETFNKPASSVAVLPAMPATIAPVEKPAAIENNVTTITPSKVEVAEVIEKVASKKYYIVVGQFGVKSNADKMVKQLKKEQPSAEVIVRKRKGLMLVAYFAASTEQDAAKLLATAKEKDQAAWIFEEN